jgi:hypothetical protein
VHECFTLQPVGLVPAIQHVAFGKLLRIFLGVRIVSVVLPCFVWIVRLVFVTCRFFLS